jgi:hypothetical protein
MGNQFKGMSVDEVVTSGINIANLEFVGSADDRASSDGKIYAVVRLRDCGDLGGECFVRFPELVFPAPLAPVQ